MNSDSSNANVAQSELVDSTLATRSAKVSDFSLFFSKFVAKGRQISSAVPSSPSMVASVLENVDFSRPATIVELGAGTGPITGQILEQLRPHHRFVAVENDRDFCEILRRRFPEVTLLESDAAKLADPLAKLGIHKVDYVLSGLPTPSLPLRSTMRLMQWLRESLTPNGRFVQITVVPVLFLNFYRRLFEQVSYSSVWMNVPPGGVYSCSRPRKTFRRPR